VITIIVSIVVITIIMISDEKPITQLFKRRKTTPIAIGCIRNANPTDDKKQDESYQKTLFHLSHPPPWFIEKQQAPLATMKIQ
jgi:hypothetical protein